MTTVGARRKGPGSSSARACLAFAAFSAFSVLAAPGAAESPLPVSEFLRGALRDSAWADASSGGAGAGASGVPWLRDAEIRLRSEAFDPGTMRYTLQLTPKGFGEEAASRRLTAALTGRGEGIRESRRHEALRERYRIVIDHAEGTVLSGLGDSLAALEEERIRVLERQSVSDAFDLGDILRAENSQTRYRERADEARARAAQALARARALMRGPEDGADPPGFDTAGLADVPTVLARLGELAPVVDTGNVHLRDARDDADEARARYRLAKAETRRYVSFVEFGYDHGNRRDELEDRAQGRAYEPDRAYLVEVGFRLPWAGSDRSEVPRRRAELTNRRAGLARERAELEEDLRGTIAEVRVLAARHASLASREEELDLDARLKRYASLAAADPLVILTLRQARLENALRRETIRFEILRGYLEAADCAGIIARRPLRNLLAARPEPLE